MRSLRVARSPEAATDAVATTGRAVVFAGATVCIALPGMPIFRLALLNGVAVAALTVVLTIAAPVFLAFVLTGDRVIALSGIAPAAAVALDAFVLRTLLVPALMHLLGGADRWLPRSLDRTPPRIGIEPPESRVAHERLAAATDTETVDAPTTEEQQRDVRDTTG